MGSKIIELPIAHVEPQVCEPALSLKITGAVGSKHFEMKTITGVSRYLSLTPRSSLAMSLKQPFHPKVTTNKSSLPFHG